MVPIERRTQCMLLSASFNREPWSLTSRLMAEAFGLGLGTAQTCGVIVKRRRQGCRRSSSTTSSWREQASPTRPEQPSLASVGGGMAAGAAFAHPRAADARVRPKCFNHM